MGIADMKPFEQIGKMKPTFTVDSDEALAAWIANAAGNDYSLVLIKKGDFHAPPGKQLDCRISSTLGVIGEIGSMLYFYRGENSTMDGVRGSGNLQEFFFNVSVTCDDEGGFFDCRNMYNCEGIAANCFWGCYNLVNCRSGNYTGFYTCEGLTNCYSFDNSIGFQYCERLYNCWARNCTEGFSACEHLFGCVVEGERTVRSYSGCNTMFGNSYTAGDGFVNCKNGSGNGSAVDGSPAGGFNLPY